MINKDNVLYYLIVLGFFDAIIPIPFSCLLLIYVVVKKPVWFKKLLDDIYPGDPV